MKQAILILSLLFLSSCGMTQEEKLNKTKECDALGRYADINQFGGIFCGTRKEDKVHTCIRGYIDAIDEKYNNPDTVSDLREDDYSTVIKTCKETFGTPNP